MEIVTKLERILVPVDFSDCSANALAYAVMLQQCFGAHIHVAHAFTVPAFVPPHAALLAGELNASSVEHAERFTAQHLREFLGKLAIKPNDTLSTSVELGPPATAIVALARREKCDLIVMGTHGRTGWSRALLGSTAEQVLRSAPCAVLTVKASSNPTHSDN